MKEITFSLIEIFISLIVETIILGGLFTFVSNKANRNQEQNIKEEMLKMETQSELMFEQLSEKILMSRNDILSQIKESAANGTS